MTEVKEALRELGFSEKETDIYLFLLQVGQAPASLIAKHVSVYRSTCYAMIEKLIRSGVAGSSNKIHILYFHAVPLDTIIHQLADKQRALTQTANQLQVVSKKMVAIPRCGACDPTVVCFKGKSGLLCAINKVLSASGGDIRALITQHTYLNLLSMNAGCDLDKTSSDANSKIIYCISDSKTISNISDASTVSQPGKAPSTWIRRFIPSLFDWGVDFIISRNCIALISFSENLGIVINSRNIAHFHARIFDFVWMMAKCL